jgi:plastocyanin
MFFNAVTLVYASTALLSLAFASTTTSSAAAGATYEVSVGANGISYTPNTVFANVGDVIEFVFYPLNHSVARAAFGEPCIPYEDSVPGGVGFWSGFRPVSIVTNDPPKFFLPINDTEPVFFYCSAPGACFDGMIGVINPNATFTYEAQFNYSQNATVEFSPLEYFPVESVNPTRTATAIDYTTTPTGTVAPQITVAASKSPPLSAGAIAGVAIGGFAVLVLAAALLYMCGRQKTVKEILRQSTIVPTNHNSYQPTALGISEVQYPNMMKNNSPNTNSTAFSANSYTPGPDNESYRSMSPPIDERTGMMMGGMHPVHFQHGQTSPGLSSPGFSNPGSPGFPSPMYSERHEMENSTTPAGLIPVHHEPQDNGPHELAVPSRNPSTANETSRPFSYTDSESGYARPHASDEKSETGTY